MNLQADYILRLSRPHIIDFEASGLGKDSYPIEVGVVLSSGEKYCSLIAPAPSWHYWDRRAEHVHGLTRENVVNHGRPAAVVAAELNKLLRGKTVYSDGWGVDNSWLNRLYFSAGTELEFSISALEFIVDEVQMNIWAQVKNQVIADLGLTRHRASNDALIIQETYTRTRQIVAGQWG